MSVLFYVDPGLSHDSWQLSGVAGHHQGAVVEGSIGGHDGEAGLTHLAGRDITTERGKNEERGRGRVASLQVSVYTYTPGMYCTYVRMYLPAIFSGSVSPDPSTNH